MKFKFTLQRESLDLLNRLLKSVGKFWADQKIVMYCDVSGISVYPEAVTEASPTYCEVTFLAPAKTILPKAEGLIECKQFFGTYLIESEKANSRVVFTLNNFSEFAKAIALLSSLKLESATTFRLTQEMVNNCITVRFRCLT